jgi:hypothetical protein
MRWLAVPLLASAALALFAPAASAQGTCAPFQVVGFTANKLKGDKGIFGFTQACQAEFGPPSRMCTSSEVLETVVLPLTLSGEAWVRPSFQPLNGASGPSALDASGLDDAPFENLTCAGWGSSSSVTVRNGLTVDKDGIFAALSCNTSRRVACCAAIPLPEPSTSLLQGSGVAALALLSRIKRVH